MVLIDSSVWIAAWRGTDPAIAQALAATVDADLARINPLIFTELLQGALHVRHQEEIVRLLDPIPTLPLPDRLWRESAKRYLSLRQKGLTLTTIDCLIGTHAMLERCPLWTTDGIFEEIRSHAPLVLFRG